MPANNEILPKYKSYVGRTFILRKHKTIPASEDSLSHSRKIVSMRETFGDACLVFDESNSRVKVTTALGGFLWISKFYLHKELVSACFKDHDYVVDLSDKLLDLRDYFSRFARENDIEDKCEVLEEAANILKIHSDNLGPKASKG